MKICANISFTAPVKPGQLKEFIVTLEILGTLYDGIRLSGQLKIFVCDEIGKIGWAARCLLQQ